MAYRIFSRRNILTNLCLCLYFAVIISLVYLNFKKTSIREFTINYGYKFADKPKQVPGVSDSNEPVFKFRELGNFETEIPALKGPGENGESYIMRDRLTEQKEISLRYGMNILVSNEISVNRSIPDTRPSDCKYWHYPDELPKASVILIFINEGLSVIARTIHSVVNRTPPQFLQEVILVDDCSTNEDLKETLETYIKENFPADLVKLFRNDKQEGLIRSKVIGAQFATGEVVVFLDSHCEVGYNWLPPLLAPIKVNKQTVTVPMIDGIEHDTFEYRPIASQVKGIFEWGLLYKEINLVKEEIHLGEHNTAPYASPTHAGGLLAINREYFLDLGGYDPDLLIWGGENFELSFKVWMCGGRVLWVPCSKVAHVYRGPRNYSRSDAAPSDRKKFMVLSNYKRVVEVWWDEYKEYFYTRQPIARFIHAGDLSSQIEIRKLLNCKPFSWFMQEVAYDVLRDFPFPPKNIQWGYIRAETSGRCLASNSNTVPSLVILTDCRKGGLFRLNEKGQLGLGEKCIEVDSQSRVEMVDCKLGTVDGHWSYDETRRSMEYSSQGRVQCLQQVNEELLIGACVNDPRQQYSWMQIIQS